MKSSISDQEVAPIPQARGWRVRNSKNADPSLRDRPYHSVLGVNDYEYKIFGSLALEWHD